LAIASPDGHILAACPLAVQTGVQPGQQVAQARLRCPEVRIRPADHEAALTFYERLLDALATCSPVIEAADSVAGVAYIDARGLSRLWGGIQGVGRVAVGLASDRGLRAGAGIGPTRLVALALARTTPMDAEPAVLLDGAADTFLRNLSLADLAPGLTSTAARTLHELGISTVGVLAELPRAGIALRFGPDVLTVWHAARGLPEPPLCPWAPPARLVVTHRDEDGLEDWTILEAVLLRMVEQLAGQLQARAQATATLSLSLRCTDGAEHLRRTRHWPPLQATPPLIAAALELLTGSRPTSPVDLVDLQASDLGMPNTVQHGLWDDAARDRRGERLAAILQTQARRHGRSMLRRWRPDPLSADGWSYDGVAGE